MSAFQKWPIISVLIAAAFIGAPILLGADNQFSSDRFEMARKEARNYWVAHPKLEVDAMGELILEPVWLEEARAAASASSSDFDIETPPRMMARAQAKLDGLVETAYSERMSADPAWRFGVLDSRTPRANDFLHAFVHESGAGILLCVVVLLFAGAPLERSWGKTVYLGFVIAAPPLTAHAFRLLDAEAGVPWSGAAGLSGAILGAYFIRSLGGHFVLPGWLLLPGWLALEAFVVRTSWIADLDSIPWATLFASVAFGALASATFRLLGVESKLDRMRAKQAGHAPNPIVMRAARLRSDGNPYQAFDLLQAAWRDNPLEPDVAEAFFASAVEVERPNAAAEAILPSLHDALRESDFDRALEYWLPLAKDETHVRLDSSTALRLAEAMMDSGHQAEAMVTLRGAVDAGVSPAHALRIVSMVEGDEPGLARKAAIVALTDAHLGDDRRATLERLVESVEAEEESDGGLWGPADADSLAGVQTSTPDPASFDDDPEAQLAAQALDVGALDLEGGEEDESLEALLSVEDFDLGDDLGDLDDPLLADLDETSSDLFDVDNFRDSPAFDPGETDSDLTPLMEASADGIHRSPLGGMVEEPVSTRDDASLSSGLLPAPPVVAAAEETTETAAPAQDEMDAGDEEAPLAPLRKLKALMAVPLEATDRSVEIDVAGRGKSQLPLHRIQAISMAAIEGLGSRSVLLVDFVLNWETASEDEPLKVIRFRSDRFDPRRFEPAEIEPLHALSAWVRRLQVRSDANCLPDRQFLEGLFLHFESIEAYEAYVLMAESVGD